jgi:putative ABC transport system ATP-binding protein
MNKIEVNNIKKSFGAGNMLIEVLHGINLEIESGKMNFLIGPSGCGKTTLISIIAGILSPTSGEVKIFGQNINKLSSGKNSEFRRQNIGFIFQQFNLLPALSAAENASIPLIANGAKRDDALKKAKEMLAKVGLENHTNKLPKELSGGQQQRVAIARALIHNPKLLVCDEPTASLDAASGKQVMEILQEQAKQDNRCVIIVTHDDRIFKFADIIIKMNDGKIIE